MRCFYCQAWNPDGYTMCQNCGKPIKPLTGKDLAGGIMGAAIFDVGDLMGRVIWDAAIAHKVRKIEDDLKKGIHALAEGQFERAVRLVYATGITDDANVYPPDYRAWYHFLLATAYTGLRKEPQVRDHMALFQVVAPTTSERFQSEETKLIQTLLLGIAGQRSSERSPGGAPARSSASRAPSQALSLAKHSSRAIMWILLLVAVGGFSWLVLPNIMHKASNSLVCGSRLSSITPDPGVQQSAPVSGAIQHRNSDSDAPVRINAGVQLRDSDTAIRFYNPYPANTHPWDVAVYFRFVGDNISQQSYFVLLDSSAQATLFWGSGPNGGVSTLAFAHVPDWDTSASGSNQVEVVADGSNFTLCANGTQVMSASIAEHMDVGDVTIGAGLTGANHKPGAVTRYDDFHVRPLP